MNNSTSALIASLLSMVLMLIAMATVFFAMMFTSGPKTEPAIVALQAALFLFALASIRQGGLGIAATYKSLNPSDGAANFNTQTKALLIMAMLVLAVIIFSLL